MTRAFDKIMAGLDDARAYLNGDRTGFAVHEIKVSDPDVVAIRSKTGLSQPAFARSIGIPLGTLKNWEQGRRRPDGPARVLLALIEKRPSIVQEESAVRTEELGNRQTNVMLNQTEPVISEPWATVDDLRDALRQFERRMTIKVYLAVCAGAFLVKVLDFLIG